MTCTLTAFVLLHGALVRYFCVAVLVLCTNSNQLVGLLVTGQTRNVKLSEESRSQAKWDRLSLLEFRQVLRMTRVVGKLTCWIVSLHFFHGVWHLVYIILKKPKIGSLWGNILMYNVSSKSHRLCAQKYTQINMNHLPCIFLKKKYSIKFYAKNKKSDTLHSIQFCQIVQNFKPFQCWIKQVKSIMKK